MGKTFLMCRPDFFDVDYVINPWMSGNIHKVDKDRASEQWQNLHGIISSLANVQLIDAVPSLPDMVFTANAAIIADGYAWISTFAKPERQPEEPHFKSWLIMYGYDTIHLPHDNDFAFEGAGDCLIDSLERFWIGSGQRTTQTAAEKVSRLFGHHKWFHLSLKSPRFYHLDTCFCPLSKGHVLWYQDAFDQDSQRVVHDTFGNLSIAVNHDDAMSFACNAVCIDQHIIMPHASAELCETLERAGYQVITTDLTEFIKAGGAAKCLTLELR